MPNVNLNNAASFLASALNRTQESSDTPIRQSLLQNPDIQSRNTRHQLTKPGLASASHTIATGSQAPQTSQRTIATTESLNKAIASRDYNSVRQQLSDSLSAPGNSKQELSKVLSKVMPDGETVIFKAAKKGEIPILNALLQAATHEVNQVDRTGKTPIIHAILSEHSNADAAARAIATHPSFEPQQRPLGASLAYWSVNQRRPSTLKAILNRSDSLSDRSSERLVSTAMLNLDNSLRTNDHVDSKESTEVLSVLVASGKIKLPQVKIRNSDQMGSVVNAMQAYTHGNTLGTPHQISELSTAITNIEAKLSMATPR